MFIFRKNEIRKIHCNIYFLEKWERSCHNECQKDQEYQLYLIMIYRELKGNGKRVLYTVWSNKKQQMQQFISKVLCVVLASHTTMLEYWNAFTVNFDFKHFNIIVIPFICMLLVKQTKFKKTPNIFNSLLYIISEISYKTRKRRNQNKLTLQML